MHARMNQVMIPSIGVDGDAGGLQIDRLELPFSEKVISIHSSVPCSVEFGSGVS